MNSWVAESHGCGTSPGRGFPESERGVNKTHCISLIQSNAKTKIHADASACGLGAVLLQHHEIEDWKPIAYASKSMSETEKHYSQIKKEALALVWACEKFTDHIIWKHIQIETDHKPLVLLLGTTQLNSLPPRVLRFWLCLTKFDYSIAHIPGMYLYTADTLFHAPIKSVKCVHENDKDDERFIPTLIQ